MMDKPPTIMKNQNDLLSNEGYNPNNNLPYFYEMTDIGDDPDQYYLDPIKVLGPVSASNSTTN